MTGKQFNSCSALVAITLVIGANSPCILAAETYHAIAVTGMTPPGTSPGLTFSYFNNVTFNGDGRAVFSASYDNPTGERVGSGIWSEDQGSLELILKTGDPLPGNPSLSFGSVFSVGPVFNEAGDSVYLTEHHGLIVSEQRTYSLWTQSAGSLVPVFYEITPLPELGENIWVREIGWPILGRGGRIVFAAELGGSGINTRTNDVIMAGSPGAMSPIVLEGVHAPGTNPNVVFGDSSPHPTFRSICINNTGQTVFIGKIDGPGVDYTNDNGIWLKDSGALQLVAREGDPFPDGTGRFKSLQNVRLNDAGQLAFWAQISSPTGSGRNVDESIWAGQPDALALIARQGEAAPGVDPGTVFATFDSESPIINGSGDTAFIATITGPGTDSNNDESLWSSSHGELSMVAREGQMISDSDTDLVIRGFYEPPVMNDLGQIAFVAKLGRAGSSATGWGLWATDVHGELHMIIGGHVNLADGSGGQDGRITSFSNTGQLVFSLGTSGVYSVTIPEPGTLVLLGVGAGLVTGRRGKRVA